MMAEKSVRKRVLHKRCIVPMCENTDTTTPNKLFTSVPKDLAKKEKWCKQMGRELFEVKSSHLVCEDHFDLPNDMINYIKYLVMGKVSKMILKPDCYPTKFDCQKGPLSSTYKDTKRQRTRKRNMGIAECLVTEDFFISSDMKTETHQLSDICSACLARDRKLHNSHTIKECFKLITNIDIPDERSLQVCWECMAYIRTILKFKATVEISQKILNEYNSKNHSDELISNSGTNSSQRLKLSTPELVDIFPEDSIDDIEIKDEEIPSPECLSESNYLRQENGEETNASELLYCKEDFEKCVISAEQIQDLTTLLSELPSSYILGEKKTKAKKKEKKAYICDYCALKCYNKNILGRHILKHTMVKAFSCDICPCKFSNKSQLMAHIYSHKRESLFRCEYCSYKSQNFTCFVAHEASHTGAKPLSCASCTYRTNKKAELVKHFKVHTDYYKFQCGFCSYKCKYSGSMKVHNINHHSYEKPFKCKVCPLQFSTKTILRKHMFTHTGEKTFCCEICAQMFASHSNLKYHMLRHIGTKKYICDICLFRCNYKCNLKAHILRVHKNKCIMAK